MAESYVAIPDGGYRFDLAVLRAAASHRWPDAQFVPSGGRLAEHSAGQFQIPDPGPGARVLLDVDLEGRILGVEAGDPADAAEVMAWIAALPGFPDDGSVLLVEWVVDFVPLAPGATADDLLELLT